MNKKFIWFIFVVIIIILFSIFSIIIFNREVDNTNKISSGKSIDIDEGIVADKAIDKDVNSVKRKYDVFKPQDKVVREQQQKRNKPILEYHSKEETPLLM